MKPLILGAAILGIVFAPVAAEAKGCIKGAIVGGIAGHMAGHGKVGVVAGCIIGHHEANRPTRKRPIRRRSLLRIRTTASRLGPLSYCPPDNTSRKNPSWAEQISKNKAFRPEPDIVQTLCQEGAWLRP